MRRVILILLVVLAFGFAANAAIINEVSYVDFSNNAAAPTGLGVYIGCSPFPPGCTDQINGSIDNIAPDTTDAFMFWSGAIEGVTMSFTYNAEPSSGQVVLYDPFTMIAYGTPYQLSGTVAGVDLLAAWGLGTSGDGVTDLPGGVYAIDVTGLSWRFPGLTTGNYQINITAAPEPGTYLLVGLGLAAFALVRRRRRV